MPVADLAVEMCGIPLRSPLLPAAGTLSKEALGGVEGVYGAVVAKTVTPTPRAGNPPPRIAETPSGMVNSIGLQNVGVEAFLRDLNDYVTGVPLVASVAGNTADEFTRLCEGFAHEERVSAVELNLSCPNVEHGGLTFCAGPEVVAGVVGACRAVLPAKPLFVKLTNEGLVANAVAAENAGADAVTAINTVPALTIDARERRVLVRGGLSGPAIKPVALRAVHDISDAVGIPVIGCGGVSSGADVVEFMLAGATAVQVGSGGYARDPRDILEEFAGHVREFGGSAAGMIGALR